MSDSESARSTIRDVRSDALPPPGIYSYLAWTSWNIFKSDDVAIDLNKEGVYHLSFDLRLPPFEASKFCSHSGKESLREEWRLGLEPGYSWKAFSRPIRTMLGATLAKERKLLLQDMPPVPLLGWLLGHLFFELGWSPRPLVLGYLWRGLKGSQVAQDPLGPSMGSSDKELLLLLIDKMVRSASYKGSDVRLITGESTRPARLSRQSFPANWLHWHTVAGVPTRADHINVLELRGYLMSLRWRSRSRQFLNKRFVHLLDSQVSIGVVSKGRSSSRKLLHLLRRIAAIMLTADSVACLPYVGTGVNPADAPSRWHQN